MKRLLLVSPDFDVESFWITEQESANAEVVNDMAPVGLATIAAMTPEAYHVDIWDEVVHGRLEDSPVLARQYDLVGLTGYNTHYLRAVEIARLFRRPGTILAAGGPGVSGMPEKYREHFDVLFIGEAERTWPRFVQDWEAGHFESEYRQIEKIDLSESPLPKWDSIAADLGRYAMGGVQTRRGCPFDCEFCDVIYLFGRTVRSKPIDRVIEEVRALERLGVSHVFFCDDEFIGDLRYTKELLSKLIPVNNSFERPITFITQATMNMSRDEELLELLADANFGIIFVGIETPNKASLKETGKLQNVRKDLDADVRKILSYGIALRAGLIVGFDHDTTDIFDIQSEFVHNTCLPSATLSMLKAISGTRLWRRLRQENRVLDITKLRGDSKGGHAFKPRSYTNIMPMSMTRIELMQGYRRLAERLYSWESFGERIRGFISNIERKPRVARPPLTAAEMESFLSAADDWPEGRAVVESIVEHAERTASYMMRTLRMLTLQHARHKKTFDGLLPHIDRLIALESSGEVSFALDNRPVPIPDLFRNAFKRESMFAEVHRHVREGLMDGSRVPEAMTEVFVDFLARWGEDFKRFEPHHSVFLRELSERTCQKLNEESPVEGPRGRSRPASVKLQSLAEDVLRNVELQLIARTRPLASTAG